MSDFYIDLNEFSSKKTRIVQLLVFGAIICVGFTLTSLSIFLTTNSSLEWFFLMAAIYVALYIYFAWLTFNAKLYVKADESGIEFKFGIRSKTANYINWSSISRLRIGYAYISFFKKSGRRRRIQLSWLPYCKVVEIKEKVIHLCKKRGVTYEIVDFIRYSKKKDK